MNGQNEGSKTELEDAQTVNYSHPTANDEIDLADLVGVLVRRRRLIFAGTLLCVIIAMGAAFLLPTKYKASSLIEIGQLYNTEEGVYQKIEGSEAVKNRIQALGQTVGWELNQEIEKKAAPETDLGFSIKENFVIHIPAEGNIVATEIKAPKDSKALTFLNRVGKRLLKSHNRIFNQEKKSIQTRSHGLEIENRNIDTAIQNLKTRISDIKRDFREKLGRKGNKTKAIQAHINRIEIQNENIATTIEDLKNRIAEIRRSYAAKIGRKENKIEQITNSVEDFNARKSFIQDRIRLIEDEKKDLQSRIKEVENRYQRLLGSKLAADDQARKAEAIGLMLFNSELHAMRKYQDQLRKRLLFSIPEQIKKLRTDLQELNSALQNRKAELSLEKKLLEQLKPEMKDKITNIEGQIQQKKNTQEENQLEIKRLNAKLENMLATRVILEPVYSERPVSPNIKLMGALGLVLGLFLSVFAAFLAEFWKQNREKIYQDS